MTVMGLPSGGQFSQFDGKLGPCVGVGVGSPGCFSPDSWFGSSWPPPTPLATSSLSRDFLVLGLVLAGYHKHSSGSIQPNQHRSCTTRTYPMAKTSSSRSKR